MHLGHTTSRVFKKFLLLATLLSVPASFANPRPEIVAITESEWQQAQNSTSSTTLQVTLPTLMFDRNGVFSSVLYELPIHFAGLKLNTIGRGLHSTIVYLDETRLSDVRSVIQFLSKLDQEALRKHRLDEPVQVLDTDNIQLMVVGTQSKFIALKPHREFIEWQMRFYQALEEFAPGILDKHKAHRNLGSGILDPERVHISLVQFGERVGIKLNETQENEVKSKLKNLFIKAIDDYKKKNGSLPSFQFSLKENPLEMVTAPRSFLTPPIPIVTYKIQKNDEPRISPVTTWTLMESANNPKTVEFYTDQLAAGSAKPYLERDSKSNSVGFGQRTFQPYPDEEFMALLPVSLGEIYRKSLLTLSPTKKPAAVPTDNESRKNHFFVTSTTHYKLAPQKAFHVLELMRSLGLKSSNNVSVGLGVYASSVREEIRNPGDSDLLVTGLVYIPDHIASIEEAERTAVKDFTTVVLGQLRKLANERKIAWSELRLGSDATMGIVDRDSISGLEENPYLSEQDILIGRYKDKKGKYWSLEELVALGDFMKGKIDLFTKGKREEISLQFLAGFSWRGSTYTFQRNGIKGLPPLLRTAVYDGAHSFANAAALSRAYDLYTAQKGAILARAIRDVTKAMEPQDYLLKKSGLTVIQPIWNSKFVKKAYNYMILLGNSGLGLDEIFFNETRRILKKESKWTDGYSYEVLFDRVVEAINQSELKVINHLKRNVNDFREFNERQQSFREDQWLTRVEETESLLGELEQILNERKGTSSNLIVLEESYKRFYDLFRIASRLPPSEGADYMVQSSNVGVLLAFEYQLKQLEGALIGNVNSNIKLTEMDQVFIQTLISYSPHFYINYLENRRQESDFKLKWIMTFLGMGNSSEMIESMKDVSSKIHALDRSKIAEEQKRLYQSCQDRIQLEAGAKK